MGMLKRRVREENLLATDEGNMIVDSADLGLGADSDESTSSEDENNDDLENRDDASDSEGEDKVDVTKKNDQSSSTIITSKKKVMLLACRGINARQRHLMDDLCLLLPQIKKESKFDSKKKLNELNELAELNGASHVILFEPRKPFELFMWIAASPSGPSVRMHVRNIHTLDELSLPGNGMRGARPILTFDAALLNIGSHGDILKKLLTAAFAPPQRHRKTRPYTDRVMHFAWQDGHIWVRNYQLLPVNSVAESELQKVVQGVQAIEGMNVVEIGPRFVLCPIRILEGAFWGRTLWQNDEYVSPAVARAAIRLESAIKSRKRMADQEISSIRKSRNVLPRNELDDVFS